MESFKAGLNRKIQAFKTKRQKVLADIEKLNAIRKDKETYIAGLEDRERKLIEDRQVFENQKKELKVQIQEFEKEKFAM